MHVFELTLFVLLTKLYSFPINNFSLSIEVRQICMLRESTIMIPSTKAIEKEATEKFTSFSEQEVLRKHIEKEVIKSLQAVTNRTRIDL